ncbi:MAG: NAD(P)/FAD-dependent oxidoreductase [Candidatus Binatia bacterium]
MSRTCVIVGAGPAGLAAAQRLAAADVKVTVLEASNAIGGRTRSERVGDFTVNTGASFLTSFYDETLLLLRALQVETLAPPAQLGSMATPFGKLEMQLSSPRGILRFPLISLAGKLRMGAMFAGIALRPRAHFARPQRLAWLDRGETIEQWGERTVGDTAYQYLLRPGVEPFFYVGAEELSAALGKALLRHALGWQLLVLPAGMGALCDALARGVEVRTGCQASGVDVKEHSVQVFHAGGVVEADYCILAVPASAIARLEGPLDREDRADVAAIRTAPNLVLYFGYDRPLTVQYPLVTPVGPGRHPIARVRTWSTICPTYVPEGKELLAIQAMGWRSAELLERDPSKIAAALRADAEEVFGRLADPDWVRLYPRAEGTVVTQPGHYRRIAAFLKRPRTRLLYAGDWMTGSTIEGAVWSGRSAAQAVLRRS